MLEKLNSKVKASPKKTTTPLPKKKIYNLKFEGIFKVAMVFGKYLHPHNINNQQRMQ